MSKRAKKESGTITEPEESKDITFTNDQEVIFIFILQEYNFNLGRLSITKMKRKTMIQYHNLISKEQ